MFENLKEIKEVLHELFNNKIISGYYVSREYVLVNDEKFYNEEELDSHVILLQETQRRR